MKYSLKDIRSEYDRLDRVCSVDTTQIEIKLNNANKRLGSFCVHQIPKTKLFERNKFSLVITISRKVMDDDDLFYDTIRHEYAHAVAYLRYPGARHGHDAVWKQICHEVGCNPKATVRNDEINRQRENDAKYVVTCRTCGVHTYYLRAGKVVEQLKQNPETSLIVCRKCGGKSFLLTEKETPRR